MKQAILAAICGLMFGVGCGRQHAAVAEGPLFKNAGIRTTVKGQGNSDSASPSISDYMLGIKGTITHAGFVVSHEYLGTANGADKIRVTIQREDKAATPIAKIVDYSGKTVDVYRTKDVLVEIHPTTEQ
jgi:hypothetical protein